MRNFRIRVLVGGLLGMGFATLSLVGQTADENTGHPGRPLELHSELSLSGTAHRLILRDGSYQRVRKYEIAGDRVRFISSERAGEWEEMPVELVDWEATRKWERDQAHAQDGEASPAMKEVAEIDKEEQAARVEEKARHPEVAPGLFLPDRDSVFALDRWQATPELVELLPNDLSTNNSARRGLATLNPVAGARASVELEGSTAHIHLHVTDPALYISLEGREDADQLISHALTVDANNSKDAASRRHGAHSVQSGFAIVRLDPRRSTRQVGAVHVSLKGEVTQDENVIPAYVEAVYDKHWLKITPSAPLSVGEYALVEILSPGEMNQTVWDFRIDPGMEDNSSAIAPIQKNMR